MWDLVPDAMLGRHIRRMLPPGARGGWDTILRGQLAGAGEAEAECVARWLAQHGASHGIRTPNVRERGRALGLGGYLDELGIPEQEAYDAQGNAFDRAALAARIGPPVRAWLAGEALPRHVFPGLHELERDYQNLRSEVAGEGLDTAESAIPADVRSMLMRWAGTAGEEEAGGAGARRGPEEISAAEDGRAEE